VRSSLGASWLFAEHFFAFDLRSERMTGTVVADSSVVESGKVLGLSRDDIRAKNGRRDT
jgi:hypothetical protein